MAYYRQINRWCDTGITPRSIAIILTFVFIAVGCSSSNNTLKYYLLHSTSQTTSNEVTQQSNELILKNVVLPQYIKQRGLVYQTSPTNIHIATEHLWAEPIEDGITKTLAQALSPLGIQLKTPQFSSQNTHSTLVLRIDDFIATWQGDVILRGQYELLNQQDNTSVIRNFYIRKPLQEDGFPASVTVMRQAIRELAQQIANE